MYVRVKRRYVISKLLHVHKTWFGAPEGGALCITALFRVAAGTCSRLLLPLL